MYGRGTIHCSPEGALYIALPLKSPHNLSTSFGMAIVVPSIYVSAKVDFFFFGLFGTLFHNIKTSLNENNQQQTFSLHLIHQIGNFSQTPFSFSNFYFMW